ncbi:MAG: xanthine dehydrogenase family protein subunit M [Betaproteobacteria bacterium]|nr:xanthine dehydrogenase family protein subunit M [Betaproteobacteria bacterium]
MKAPAFAYVKPASLEEVFELLARYGDEAKLLAGGQSLIAALNMRLAAPRVLVDINALPSLSGIRVADGTVAIGALTRHRAVETSPEIARHLPLLAQALPHVAHAAIRNRGTFGGSIAFADPAAELPACSVALDAKFVIASRRGSRRVPARKFFKGLYETDLAAGEVLVAGEFPALAPGYRSAFQELARRRGDYAVVGLAGHARIAQGRLSDVRLAYFGVGAAPVLARRAAHAIEAGAGPKMIAAAQETLDGDLAPFDDVHTNGAARLHLARVLLGRVVSELWKP